MGGVVCLFVCCLCVLSTGAAERMCLTAASLGAKWLRPGGCALKSLATSVLRALLSPAAAFKDMEWQGY